MGRLYIDDKAEIKLPRLARLCAWSKELAFWKLTRLWKASQTMLKVAGTRDDLIDWLEIEDVTAIDQIIGALVECEYLSANEDGTFRVRGNTKHVKKLRNLKNNGKRGGKKTASKPGKHKPEQKQNDTAPQDVQANATANAAANAQANASTLLNTIQCSSIPCSSTRFDSDQLDSAQQEILLPGRADAGDPNAIPVVVPNARPAAKTTPVWEAYREAFCTRYHTDPIRNHEFNIAASNLIKKLGADIAPAIAAFYVSHNDWFYVKNGHPLPLAVKDAQKLHTEYQTGQKITGTQAKQAEQADFYQDQMRRIANGEL
jgi:hypothetical protein